MRVATNRRWVVWCCCAAGAAPAGLADLCAQSRPAAAEPAIAFLSAEQARIAVLDDSVDPFFKSLEPLEMGALTGGLISGAGLEEQRAECRRRFEAGMLAFSDREREALRRLIADLRPRLARKYPRFAAVPWSFIKSSGGLCGAMPYTRGRHIVCPEPLLRMCVAAAAGRDGPVHRAAVGVLVHEQMHVFQRTHPGFFDSLYTDVFGFEYAERLDSHPLVRPWQLSNPDGTDCRWVYPLKSDPAGGYILPLLMLNQKPRQPHLPGDMWKAAVAVDKVGITWRIRVDTDGKPILRRLNGVAEYLERFAGIGSDYHPNEIGADLFTELFLHDSEEEESVGRGSERGHDRAQAGGAPTAARELRMATRRWFEQHLSLDGTPGSRPARPARSSSTR
ncbi:MAG: hypothetical protein HRF43_08240 [Phycisphaerae bacterium]|jgi:hypothetical protein